MLGLVKFYMPESPRWLIQNHRDEDAKIVLSTLYPGQNDEVEEVAQEIKQSIDREEEAFNPGWRFLICNPTPAYKRMLIAGVIAGISQQVVGISAIAPLQTFVLDQSGVHDRYYQALTLLGIQTMKCLVTFGSAKLLDTWGRRTLSFISIAGIVISLLILAADFHLSSGSSAAAVVGLLGYMCSFAIGMGPVAWLVPSEIFTTSIRAKGTSISTFCNRAVSAILSTSFLELVKAISWSGAFLLLVVLSLMMAWLIALYVPETKGRSLEEMALLFANLTGDQSVFDHLKGEHANADDSSDQTKKTESTTNEPREII